MGGSGDDGFSGRAAQVLGTILPPEVTNWLLRSVSFGPPEIVAIFKVEIAAIDVELARRQADLTEKLRDIRQKPAVTLDGTKISLLANIEGAAEIESVRESGAEGVGLFRTEYLFINRSDMPGYFLADYETAD